MAQPKGSTGNPNGRPTGSKNERTKQWEALGKAIMEQHAERFNEVLDKLDDEKFCQMYLSSLEYFQPKLQRTEMKHEGSIGIGLEFKEIYE